jgi:hypothetical protein
MTRLGIHRIEKISIHRSSDSSELGGFGTPRLQVTSSGLFKVIDNNSLSLESNGADDLFEIEDLYSETRSDLKQGGDAEEEEIVGDNDKETKNDGGDAGQNDGGDAGQNDGGDTGQSKPPSASSSSAEVNVFSSGNNDPGIGLHPQYSTFTFGGPYGSYPPPHVPKANPNAIIKCERNRVAREMRELLVWYRGALEEVIAGDEQ